jgi:hypothetical protein
MEEESSQKDHRSPRTAPDGGGEGVYREGEDFGAVGATRAKHWGVSFGLEQARQVHESRFVSQNVLSD